MKQNRVCFVDLSALTPPPAREIHSQRLNRYWTARLGLPSTSGRVAKGEAELFIGGAGISNLLVYHGRRVSHPDGTWQPFAPDGSYIKA